MVGYREGKGARDLAQQNKHLPGKHEFLSLILYQKTVGEERIREEGGGRSGQGKGEG